MAYLDVSMSDKYRSEYAILAEKSLSLYRNCCTQAKLCLTEYAYYQNVSEYLDDTLPASLDSACKSYVWHNRFSLSVDIKPTLFIDSSEVFVSSVRPSGVKIASLDGILGSAWVNCERDLNPDELFPNTGKGWMLLEVANKVKIKTHEIKPDLEVKLVTTDITGVLRGVDSEIQAKLTMHRYFIRSIYKEVYEHLLSYRRSVNFNLTFKAALSVAFEVFRKDRHQIPETEFMLKYLGKTSVMAFVNNVLSNINHLDPNLPYFFRKRTKYIELYCKKSTTNNLSIPGLGKFTIIPKNPDLKFSMLKMTREPFILRLTVYGKNPKNIWYTMRPANGNI